MLQHMQQPLFRLEIENFLLATDIVCDDICTLAVTWRSQLARRERDKKLMVALPAHLPRVHRSVTRGQGPSSA